MMGRRPELSRTAQGTRRGPGEIQPGVEVQLLGGFRVRCGGQVVDATTLRLRHARHLLALLALAPGQRLAREELMEALWPEAEPEVAANRFHYALHAARRALAPAAAPRRPALLPLRGGVLALTSDDSVAIDVAAFEAAAMAAGRAHDPAAYEAALALYTGDLLPEERYEDWATAPRERLRGTYLALLAELARLLEARDDYAGAAGALGRLLAHDPAHEDAHLGLMRLLALQGQRQEALRQYGRLREALRRELDIEPPPAAQQLYRDVLAGRFPPERAAGTVPAPAPAGPDPAHNLPAALTSFVGRRQECAAIVGLLDGTAEPRLVTLTGTGGCGKTRLATEAARLLAASAAYPDGVRFVDLAGLADPALVPGAVARALGLREEPGRPLAATLAAALRPRRLLLVLDNCEHLIDACAELTSTLLGACPNLRVLATSRAALRVPGEQAWRVPSLPVPELRPASGDAGVVAALEASDAARLFAARARLVRPDFALTAANAPAVAEVCRRLDGLPLALELAAARLGTLAVEQLAARLDDALALLTAGSRTAPARQRTLRATLDWSHDLLAADERALLRRLAVFAGGCTLDAADAVCGELKIENVKWKNEPQPTSVGAGGEPLSISNFSFSILDALSALVDHSLVQVDADAPEARYQLLEPVRQYAAERLVASGEAEVVDGRHGVHYLALARAAPGRLRGPQQIAELARLEREHDNFRAALRWALAREDVETALGLAGGLWPFWWLHGHIAEGNRWLDAALALAGEAPAAARANALMGAAVLAQELGQIDRAVALHEATVALQRQLGDQAGLAFALNNLAMVLRDDLGDLGRARQLQEESLALLRGLGVRAYLPRTLDGLGLIALLQGDRAGARGFLDESLDLSREIGDTLGVSNTLRHLGLLAIDEGDYDRARALLAEDAALVRELGQPGIAADCCEALAEVALARGAAATAARLLGAAEALRGAAGQGAAHEWRTRRERTTAALRAGLGEAAYAEAVAAGRSLTLEAALAEAFALPGEPAV